MHKHDYLNPDFIPQHADEDWCSRTQTSRIACDLWSLICVVESAFDAESEDKPKLRGVSGSLEVARHMANDLIKRCELLESEVGRTKSTH